MKNRINIPEADLDPIKDSDGKPDFTEGKTYEQVLEIATGAKYDSLEELIQARSKVSFWDKLKLTWQGKTQVGRIAGTVLDVAELIAPSWAVKTRDLLQSKTNKEENDMNWIIERLQEKTTWRGIIAAATALGMALSPELKEAIIIAGIGLVGLIEAISKEQKQ